MPHLTTNWDSPLFIMNRTIYWNSHVSTMQPKEFISGSLGQVNLLTIVYLFYRFRSYMVVVLPFLSTSLTIDLLDLSVSSFLKSKNFKFLSTKAFISRKYLLRLRIAFQKPLELFLLESVALTVRRIIKYEVDCNRNFKTCRKY